MTQALYPDWWQPQEKVSQALTTQQDVSAFDTMLAAGNYQGAYNLGKARGYDDQTLAAYADSKDGGAWRTATTQPGKTLDQGLANTFASTPQNFDTLNAVVPSAFQNAAGNQGMGSDAFRNLAGSATTPEAYWQGMAGLIGAGARANDANTNSVNPGDNLTLTQDALARAARAQYAAPRMSAEQLAADQTYGAGQYGSDYWMNNAGMERLTGLSLDARNSTGFHNIPDEWLRRNTSAEAIASAKDPAAYLRNLALTYYATPESSASAASSPENEAQWQDMLSRSRVIRDPKTGGYLLYDDRSGNFQLLNEYGTGVGVYDPAKSPEWSQSGIDPSLFGRLRAGEGEVHQFKQVPKELTDRYYEGGTDALWGWNTPRSTPTTSDSAGYRGGWPMPPAGVGPVGGGAVPSFNIDWSSPFSGANWGTTVRVGTGLSGRSAYDYMTQQSGNGNSTLSSLQRDLGLNPGEIMAVYEEAARFARANGLVPPLMPAVATSNRPYYHYGFGPGQQLITRAAGGQQFINPIAAYLDQIYQQRSGAPVRAKCGGHIQKKACGGLAAIHDDPATKRFVRGGTGGQEDKIPALVSDGEYVIDADVVAALGDGNSEAGARKLDEMRENVRRHKRGGSVREIPPKAKPIGAYMKGR